MSNKSKIHDANNCLSGVVSAVTLLEMEEGLTNDQKKYIEIIRKASNDLKTVLQAM